jgi:high-affinity nickel permease
MITSHLTHIGWLVADQTIPILLGGALLLGLRHGLDCDHVAAILDIVGSNTASGSDPNMQRILRSAAGYASGHAAVVIALGLAAIQCAAVLPAWIDPIMQRVVGLTLIALSVVLFWSFFRSRALGQPVKFYSRWSAMFALARGARAAWAVPTGPAVETNSNQPVTMPTAFAVGAVHGIGAETGTQVLIISAAAGAANHAVALALLLTFVAGIVVSNMVLGWLAISGLNQPTRFRPIYSAAAVTTAIFSLAVGLVFALGYSENIFS